MSKITSRKRLQSANSDSSDDEPLIKKVNKSTKRTKNNLDSDSSSESDIENYLQPINQIDLKSSFFDIQKSPDTATEPAFDKIEKNIFSGVSRLTDTDSDDDDDDNEKPTISQPATTKLNFKQLHEYNNKLNTVKRHVEEYNSKKIIKEHKDDISDLLAAGEVNKPSTSSNHVSQTCDDESDFDTCSEASEDWEDVNERKEIPKEGLQITVDMPNTIRKKKGKDLLSSIKRRFNRIKKENQIFVHKVHLLCWIAHGNYVNSVINNENILALALSLLPSQHCYPADRTDLGYLEQILKWYRNKIEIVGKESDSADKKQSLYEIMQTQINKKETNSKEVFIYIFIAILRSLGIQCRLILSFQVEPLRPPNSELYSLSTKANEKNDEKKSKTSKHNKSHDKTSAKTSKAKSQINSKRDKEKEVSKKPSENKTKGDSRSKTISKRGKSTEQSKISVMDDKLTKLRPKRVLTDAKKSLSKTEVNRNKKEESPNKDKPQTKSLSQKLKLNAIKKLESSNSSKVKDVSENKNEPQIRILLPNKKDSEIGDSSKIRDNLKGKNKPQTKSLSEKLNLIDKKKLEPVNSSKVKNNSEKQEKSHQTKSLSQKLKLNLTDKKKLEPVNSSKVKNNSEKQEESHQTKSLSQKLNLICKGKLDKATPTTKDKKNKTTKKAEASKQNNEGSETARNKLRTRSQTKIPQLDGLYDSDTSEHSINEGPLVNVKKTLNSKQSKPNLLKLKQYTNKPSTNKTNIKKSSTGKNCDSGNVFSPNKQLPKNNDKPNPVVNLTKLKSIDSESKTVSKPSSERNINSKKTSDVRNIVKNLIKGRIEEQKQLDVSRTVKKRKNTVESDDSDYVPVAIKKKHHESDDEFVPKVRVKRRIPVKDLDTTDINTNKKRKGVDVWAEVFLETEEKWISVDVIQGSIHCINELHKRATVPVCYVVAWNNNNSIKDVTARYCKNFNTVTRKLRVDQKWWEETVKPYIGKQTVRDREEDNDLAQQQLDKPLPTSVAEYKNHPLYVLKRHLLKFEGIYPENAATLGFVRNEAVYSRQCVYTLHSRDIWLKHAKVVKPGEKPYKIVKARPKYDKLSNSIITDQLLEIFGPWQVNDYEPPTAENGIVPKNAFGNVDLFKPSMLPKKTVHLQLPGLHKLARRMNIDCASAIIGFDFHGGWSHPVYDGYIVCEEFADILIAAWELEQEEIVKKEQDKREKRVYGNWKKLIKGLLIRERLKARYNFDTPGSSKTSKKIKDKKAKKSLSEESESE